MNFSQGKWIITLFALLNHIFKFLFIFSSLVSFLYLLIFLMISEKFLTFHSINLTKNLFYFLFCFCSYRQAKKKFMIWIFGSPIIWRKFFYNLQFNLQNSDQKFNFFSQHFFYTSSSLKNLFSLLSTLQNINIYLSINQSFIYLSIYLNK